MDRTDNTGNYKHLYGRLQVLEREDRRLEPEERLNALKGPLLDWYETHARILPWREDPAPYRVWISEIMLQQTRVEAVKPYFERFLRELPDIRALAEAEEDRLMKLWEGLGYYNRARNLKKAAQIMVERYDAAMPASYEELLSLPGIGSYTAGAISSIAYGQPVPAVDGNVLRVLSRVLASYEDILKQSTKKNMEQLLCRVIPRDQASHFNQGLIEIGAIVCVPNGHPHCGECPLASVCIAYKEQLTGELPIKTPARKRRVEKRTVCILEREGRIALCRRPDTGLLASLYELPNVEGHLTPKQAQKAFLPVNTGVIEIERLPDAKHIFSHVEWHMIGYRLRCAEPLPECYIAAEPDALKSRYSVPNAFAAYTRLIGER